MSLTSLTVAGALAVALCVTAAMTALGAPLEPRLPRFAHPDRGPLVDAGWPRPLAAWEAVRAAAVTVAVALAMTLDASPLAVAPFAAIVPSLILRDRARVARERARREVTRVIAGAHAALRSGAALAEALRRGAESSRDPLARRPFDRALRSFGLGASLDSALHEAALREADERTRLALDTLALGIAERLPIERIASLVGSLAERLAYEERLDDEVRARAAGARLQVRILAGIVPCLAVYLFVTTPGVGATLAGPIGRTVLVPAALALELTGLLLSRRVISTVLR